VQLPARDAADPFVAIKAYRLEEERGFVIKGYGDDLTIIKASNRTQGCCLFFSLSEVDGAEVLAAPPRI
jgi:hypothetical protein